MGSTVTLRGIAKELAGEVEAALKKVTVARRFVQPYVPSDNNYIIMNYDIKLRDGNPAEITGLLDDPTGYVNYSNYLYIGKNWKKYVQYLPKGWASRCARFIFEGLTSTDALDEYEVLKDAMNAKSQSLCFTFIDCPKSFIQSFVKDYLDKNTSLSTKHVNIDLMGINDKSLDITFNGVYGLVGIYGKEGTVLGSVTVGENINKSTVPHTLCIESVTLNRIDMVAAGTTSLDLNAVKVEEVLMGDKPNPSHCLKVRKSYVGNLTDVEPFTSVGNGTCDIASKKLSGADMTVRDILGNEVKKSGYVIFVDHKEYGGVSRIGVTPINAVKGKINVTVGRQFGGGQRLLTGDQVIYITNQQYDKYFKEMFKNNFGKGDIVAIFEWKGGRRKRLCVTTIESATQNGAIKVHYCNTLMKPLAKAGGVTIRKVITIPQGLADELEIEGHLK